MARAPAGVRHGPLACAQHGHRTGPQGTPGCRRVRMGAHCPLQILKGPLARPQCSPDDRNLKIHTFNSNRDRVLKIAFFVPKCNQRPPRQALGGSGSLGMLVQPMWGLEFDPEAALVAQSRKTTLFTQIEPQNLIVCQEVRTSGTPARPRVPQAPHGCQTSPYEARKASDSTRRQLGQIHPETVKCHVLPCLARVQKSQK